MIKKYNSIGLLAATPGLILIIWGTIMVNSPNREIAIWIGQFLFVVGLAYYAKAKGRNPFWGLLGFFYIFGIIILAVLEDRAKKSSKSIFSVWAWFFICLGAILFYHFMEVHNTRNYNYTSNNIVALSKAIENYRADYGLYPPDLEKSNMYSDSALVIFLDGNPNNGGPQKKYFTFSEDYILCGQDEKLFLIPSDKLSVDGIKYLNIYGYPFYYRNLSEDKIKQTKLTQDPKTDEINIHSFQIYTFSNPLDPPYLWVTNYNIPLTDPDPKNAILFLDKKEFFKTLDKR